MIGFAIALAVGLLLITAPLMLCAWCIGQVIDRLFRD